MACLAKTLRMKAKGKTEDAKQGLGELLSSFRNPPLEFRPLQIIHDFSYFEQRGLSAQALVELLVERGCGGAVTNVAWGDDYLANEEEWEALKAGIRLLQAKGLTVWLYDEKGYPSGTAGEQVLKGHPEWGAMGVFCSGRKVRAGEKAEVAAYPFATEWVHCVALPLADGTVEPARAVHVPFSASEPVCWTAPAGEWLLLCFATRVLWKHTIPASEFGWVDHAYVNLLTSEATEAFCTLTHHAYARRLDDCWDRIDAIFTDEPALIGWYFGGQDDANAPGIDRSVADFITSAETVMTPGDCPPSVPWEAGFPAWFEQMKGYPVGTALPALFLDFPGAGTLRCDFYDVLSAKAADSYLGVIRRHCDRLGIASAGHMVAEDWLHQHVMAEGDLYRTLRRFHIPGVDMLVGKPETIMASQLLTIPKLASSVAHVTGASGAMIEHWDFCERHGWLDPWPLSMEERIATLSLLFALGIDIMVSYMPFTPLGSPLDARLRPRVPRPYEPLGPEYRAWTDCAGRLAQLLRGGTHVCDIALYYPIEGVHAAFVPSAAGQPCPRDAIPAIRASEDTYVDTCRTLLNAQRDFDLIDDEAFDDARFEGGRLDIADERYHVLILTHTPVIPLKVLRGMLSFTQAGGLLMLAGPPPEGPAEQDAQDEFERLWRRLPPENVLHAATCAAIPSLLAERVAPDLVLEPAVPHVVALHKRHPGRDTYLLVNTCGDALDFRAYFAAQGDALRLDPTTGAVTPLESRGRTFAISLKGYESVAVVFAWGKNAFGTLYAAT